MESYLEIIPQHFLSASPINTIVLEPSLDLQEFTVSLEKKKHTIIKILVVTYKHAQISRVSPEYAIKDLLSLGL